MNSLIWEGRNLPAYQISARDLNPRPRYYYFRFLKTNVRRVGILLPVPIFTPASRHAILYMPTKFRPNRTLRDIAMMSYPFLPERDYVTFGSLLSQFRLSVCLSVVCLSVTLVHPTQRVEPFGKICSPLCTLAIL